MTKNLLVILFVFSTSLFFISCEKDDPEVPNEEELITTVNFYLTPTGGGDAITLSFVDLDGDGGNAPTITGGTLTANSSYNGRLELLNESETPVEDITDEVRAEDDEHQFFFDSNITDVSFTYDDEDDAGNPVGLSSILAIGGPDSGNITITLVHEPVKAASGVSDGDITNAQGEIDIEVTFPLVIE